MMIMPIWAVMIRTFGDYALCVNVFVRRAFAIQLIAQPGSNTGGYGGGISAFAPIFLGDRTGSFLGVGRDQRAHVASFLMGHQGSFIMVLVHLFN